MALDPQAKAMLDRIAALGLPPTHTLPPEEARRQAEATRLVAPGEEVARVEDRVVPTADAQIPVRVYTPEGSGPFPALVFYHGGGWVMGSVPGSDATCRSLANAAGCVVVSVEYRLAPEAKFPAAAEDCFAATRWVVEQASSLNIDPARVAVGGISAGGNLAAVVALMARDRPGSPGLVHQLLVVPVTDRNFDTASYRDNSQGYGLTTDTMRWYWSHYLRDEQDALNPYAAPLRSERFDGLPPATVITAECDPLRDEGAAYADRLRAAGVAVQYTCYEGMVHSFFSMAAFMDKGQQAVDQGAAALRAAFAGQPAVPAGD
jgi:acetyl esterase